MRGGGLSESARIGIIGGSGFYSLLENPKRVSIDTEFGKPSDDIAIGTIDGRAVAFLPRHGGNHTLAPHKVPYRANIEALHSIGVERIIATSAVGSLVPEYAPGDLVLFDQFVNMTHGRGDTFFEFDKVAHVSTAEPYCPELRAIAAREVLALGMKCHASGTVVVVNGPRFSSKAESKFFAGQGFQLVNMTQYPEIALAREMEMCYLGIGIVTDYDSGLEGRPDVRHVTMDEVNRIFTSRVADLKILIPRIAAMIPKERASCKCGESLKGAFVSQ
ncbi:S-methyl-5'-thioadenosine phosphorylase [uncultured archaeon]|nr:S-methyl-5'-thioadenosine phosphorylase [uncultured archaeon]